jgi:hypothetical protein
MSGTIRRAHWMRAWRTTILAGCLLRPAAAAAAPKVDVVLLANGDRATCEIKKLQQGELTISTDPFDTVKVHWGQVIGLTSPREFEVTSQVGDRYYGSLRQTAQPGELVVVASGLAIATLKLDEVTSLVPIGGSLWSRMDGNLDVGFSFAQANLETHWTLNAGASYRSRTWLMSSTVASQLTAREDADKTSRNTLSASANRLYDTWFIAILGQVQQNEELDLDLRTVGGGGLGRVFSQSNHRWISGFAGVVYTRERFTNQPINNLAELALGGEVDFFTPGTNDLRLTNTVVTYYSDGRQRLETQSALRYEFWKDFYWSLNAVESFDSQPPDNGKRNDFSMSLSIGWKF